MFGRLRDPRGKGTLLMAGVALLALAGFLLALPAPAGMVAALAAAAGGIGCLIAWGLAQRSDPYDLRRLGEEPSPPEEPFEDTLSEEGAPYCGWCDEAYAPGTRRCLRCARDLG